MSTIYCFGSYNMDGSQNQLWFKQVQFTPAEIVECIGLPLDVVASDEEKQWMVDAIIDRTNESSMNLMNMQYKITTIHPGDLDLPADVAEIFT